MSIFVQQPARKRQGLSGLGALAALLPGVRERGVAAIADADWACDFEAIYASVYDDLSHRPMYRGRTEALRADAAAEAHAIWLDRCPQASYTENNINLYNQAGGVDWFGRRRIHGGGGHHHHHHAGGGAGGGGGGGAMAQQFAPAHSTMRAMGPSSMRSQPMHRSGGYTPQQHASHAAPNRSGGTMHAQGSRSRGMRGFGDGTVDASSVRALTAQLQASRGSSGSVPALVNARTASSSVDPTAISAQGTWTPGDWDGSGGASPVGQTAFTVEGALPTAVAGLLGVGVGLVIASILVGK